VLLTEHLKTEKLEHTQALRELGQAGRSRKEASSSPAGRNAASPSAAQGQAEQHIADLRRQLQSEEEAGQQLRDTMREMVDDYSRQLEVRDQHIRRLEAACDSEVAMLAQKEVEVLKQENRMLRDKVAHMSDEIAHLGAGAASDANYRALQDEVDRLSQLLMEKDRQLDREMADQKHEWAEIYNAQKAQND
jgi:predicted RNase H-like nuclease (RuvC/YqgF family)